MKGKPDFSGLYAIAEGQAGYFSARQARTVGYSYERLSELARNGQFTRVEHGIYRLMHFPASRFEDLHVAVLRVGSEAVISHQTALGVYDLSDVVPTKIHIIMPRSGSRRRKDLQLHTNSLESNEITRREGFQITTVERTIADVIMEGLAYQHVRQSVEQAIRSGLTTRKRLGQYSERRGGKVFRIVSQILEGLQR